MKIKSPTTLIGKFLLAGACVGGFFGMAVLVYAIVSNLWVRDRSGEFSVQFGHTTDRQAARSKRRPNVGRIVPKPAFYTTERHKNGRSAFYKQKNRCNLHDISYAGRVLGGKSSHCTHGIYSICSHCLDIRLDTGASARITSCDC